MNTPIRNDSLFLSVSEAAILLQVTAPTVRACIRAGRLHAARPGGELGQLRVPVSEIDRLTGER
jgi:excisionase family DNA binding protein